MLIEVTQKDGDKSLALNPQDIVYIRPSNKGDGTWVQIRPVREPGNFFLVKEEYRGLLKRINNLDNKFKCPCQRSSLSSSPVKRRKK